VEKGGGTFAGVKLLLCENPLPPIEEAIATAPHLLRVYPETRFLVDEAFIGCSGETVVSLVPHYRNLLVTRTLSKSHSLAGFRVGYAILPEDLADDLNAHNDAYPLARPSQVAAVATMEHEEKIRERVRTLRTWTDQLAAAVRRLGGRTFPSETYFLLADLAPHDAAQLAEALRAQNILIEPLHDERLGAGYMRVTTALPADNARFVEVLTGLLR
jgi:histidinol-phosphate aminotransferase